MPKNNLAQNGGLHAQEGNLPKRLMVRLEEDWAEALWGCGGDHGQAASDERL
jgi:hypothetical protein